MDSDSESDKRPKRDKVLDLTKSREKSKKGKIISEALTTCGVLLSDDASGVGVIDDLAIPYFIIKAICDIYNIQDEASDSSKSEKHGDRGRAKTKKTDTRTRKSIKGCKRKRENEI